MVGTKTTSVPEAPSTPQTPPSSPSYFIASPNGTLHLAKASDMAEYKCAYCGEFQFQVVVLEDRMVSCDYCFGPVEFVRVVD